MTTILQLNSSVFSDSGTSSSLADTFVQQWYRREPDALLIRRDLASDSIPHLTAETFAAAGMPPQERTPAQANAARLADTLVAEVLRADVLVIGLPVYNFNLPSTLKAWFDHVARAGTTFRYGSDGPEGLLPIKHAYIFTASGGRYAGGPADFQAPYLKHMLGFLGINNVTFTYAEGLSMGDAGRESAVARAEEQIEVLLSA